ncbi:hypothetical protein [Microbacterium sp.]|uniref:hypothetical protein n=1 Tax=Microbacterium sp. TaxID=51671 RepID=UPI00273644A9|nr:hypothetical protein [Microbacterium sp.]MDP3952612.1 hypothetical protein [Microbacterium sp.]
MNLPQEVFNGLSLKQRFNLGAFSPHRAEQYQLAPAALKRGELPITPIPEHGVVAER